MSDIFPQPDPENEPESTPARHSRALGIIAYSLALVLVAVVATLSINNVMHDGAEPEESSPGPSGTVPPEDQGASEVPLAFGEQDAVVDSVTLPGGETDPSLVEFDVEVDPVDTSTPQAAMVSFRVECAADGDRVSMQTDGKVSTNIFLARGGHVAGQALTPETSGEVTCNLLASAPFIEATDDGASSLPIRADLRRQPTDGAHVPALHRLEDATLIRPGTNQNLLSVQIDDPAALDKMSTTVRLTSCTVVGGSSDSGQNKCQASMTGRESSTVRMHVIARWLDEDGNITSTTTYWDETLAVDYNTHHVPWTLRQADMAAEVPEDAQAVVLVVQAESLAGTPVVVHADGTESIITTSS